MKIDAAMPLLGAQATPDARAKDADEAKRVAQDFEALFVGEVFKSMRATVPGGQDNFGRAAFTGMLDEQFAKEISQSGGLGLARVLESELCAQSTQVSAKPVDASHGTFVPTTTEPALRGDDHED